MVTESEKAKLTAVNSHSPTGDAATAHESACDDAMWDGVLCLTIETHFISQSSRGLRLHFNLISCYFFTACRDLPLGSTGVGFSGRAPWRIKREATACGAWQKLSAMMYRRHQWMIHVGSTVQCRFANRPAITLGTPAYCYLDQNIVTESKTNDRSLNDSLHDSIKSKKTIFICHFFWWTIIPRGVTDSVSKLTLSGRVSCPAQTSSKIWKPNKQNLYPWGRTLQGFGKGALKTRENIVCSGR